MYVYIHLHFTVGVCSSLGTYGSKLEGLRWKASLLARLAVSARCNPQPQMRIHVQNSDYKFGFENLIEIIEI